jgi:hypothetical protein
MVANAAPQKLGTGKSLGLKMAEEPRGQVGFIMPLLDRDIGYKIQSLDNLGNK